MGFRTRTAVGLVAALAGLTMIVTPAALAAADDFPRSTNDANRVAEKPHVNELSKGPGTVTLEFVNPTYWLAFFEIRIDGEVVDGPEHPVVDGDVIYPGKTLDCRSSETPRPPCANSPQEFTIPANATVEVRHALGGENQWFFDWVEFTVGPIDPTSKNDCKKGGWETFGFRNQGQCIKFVNTGKDSR